MSLTKKTIKAGTWQLISVVVKVFVQLFVIAILARHIPLRDFGLIALANMVLVFVEMFAEAGIGAAIIQKKILTNEDIRVGFTLSVLSGIIFVVVLWLISPLVAKFFKMEYLNNVIKWLGLSILFIKFGTISRSLLERDMRLDKLLLVDVGSYIFGYAPVGIGMAILGYGVWSIVIGKLVQSFMQSVFLFLACSHSTKPFFRIKECRDIGIYGGGLTIARFFDNIASQGDLFIVGRFCGVSLLGIYERSVSLTTMPGQYIGQIIDKAMFPAMSIVQDDSVKLQNAYLRTVSIVSMILVSSSILMFLVAPELIEFLLGPKWIDAIVPFRILVIMLNFRIAANLSDVLVRATGKVYASAKRKVVFAFLVILGSWIGQHWGIIGVAIFVNIAILTNYFMITQLSIKLMKLKFLCYFRNFKDGYIVGGVLLFISFPIISLLRFYFDSSFVVLFVGCIASILILFVTIVYFSPALFDNSVFWFLFQIMGVKSWKLPLVGKRIKLRQNYFSSNSVEIS